MGNERTGPGDGYGGWRFNAASEDGQEIEAVKIAEEMLARCCVAFQQQGYLHPTMWAVGSERTVFAIATDDQVARVGPLVSSVLLGLMAKTVEAVAVGSVLEMFTKELGEDYCFELTLDDMKKLADVDPTVRTSLVMSWFDLSGDMPEAESSIASFVLNDQGVPTWEMSNGLVLDSPYEAMAEAAACGGYSADNAKEAMISVGKATGWQLFIEDEEGTWRH
jgi:hypothetical protein